MSNNRFIRFLLAAVLTTAVYSCTKSSDDFEGQGGMLPTHYINIKDSSFSPVVLSVATGSSITFVNTTDFEHSIVDDDSSVILSGLMQRRTSFFFKKDTIGTINYHCGVHPGVKGTIILTP